MTTISLRTLVREPRKVKRITRAGKPVQVNDNGKPLWILQPAAGTESDEAARRETVEKVLDEVRREQRSGISAAQLLENSRR